MSLMRSWYRFTVLSTLLTACDAESIVAPTRGAAPVVTASADVVATPAARAVIACGRRPPASGPLVILDGRVVRGAPQSRVDPATVDTVEVVAGAAGASLYGTDAALGVVILRSRQTR
jgi:hypothetical protein